MFAIQIPTVAGYFNHMETFSEKNRLTCLDLIRTPQINRGAGTPCSTTPGQPTIYECPTTNLELVLGPAFEDACHKNEKTDKDDANDTDTDRR